MLQTIERKVLKFIIKESLKGVLQDAGRAVAKSLLDNFQAELKKSKKKD